MTATALTLPSVTVLLVDDDIAFRHSTARILAIHGYSCIEAAGGPDTRSALKSDDTVSVVLCDIKLAAESGLEILREVATELPHIAVIMTTGIGDPSVASTAFDLGAAGYLIKPFSTNELLISVANALRARNVEVARVDQPPAGEDPVSDTLPTSDVVPRSGSEPDPVGGAGGRQIRVLIVDDHTIFADSLTRLLASSPDLTVVGSAGTVADAVVAVADRRPDVVLMDYELPDGDGPRAAEAIRALSPTAAIVMLTAHTDNESISCAISSGCVGFVRKVDAVETLLDAIRAACDGEALINPTELSSVLRCLPPTNRGLGAAITTREREILHLMADGLVNKQIASILNVRLNTVRKHVQNILDKLESHSKLEAVATAVRERIIMYPTDA